MAENLQEKFNLTSTQMEEFKAAFAIFDANNDGLINTQELGDVLKQLGQDPTEEEIADIINDVDDNADGVLQFDEFLQLMVKQMSSDDDNAEFREAFKVFDKDGDGFISKEELNDVMAKVGEKLSKEEIDEMVKQADKNHDGKIDYEEFIQMMGGRK